ncbi:hypothetical protein [Mycobacterium sp. 141]|uniref:hypothetical protein n=1 Tax=Mycobacterium sp. 141 TaxID=1120797 RepID=UPI0012DC5E70|nr:hypothetical protein [Mycobacterium sp. 141]
MARATYSNAQGFVPVRSASAAVVAGPQSRFSGSRSVTAARTASIIDVASNRCCSTSPEFSVLLICVDNHTDG